MLHRRAFEVLESAGVAAASLVQHALAAGLLTRAFELSITAGAEARRVLAARDSAVAYQQAIQLAHRVGRSEMIPELHARPPVPKPETTEWFLRMLDAPLSAEDLARLGSVRAAPSRQEAANQ